MAQADRRNVVERDASGALEAREGKLRAAARLAQLGYWDYDVDEDRVSWSEETAQIFGLPTAERTRRWEAFMRLVHPDDRATFEECRARMLRGTPRGRVCFRFVRADGRVQHLESISEPVRDEIGRTARIVGAIQDVSERKQAEDVLRGSRERLRLALQATGLGHWDWDVDTNEVNFWPEWKRQLGYEPDEIPNRYEEWESRLHPDDRDRVLASLRAYLDGREPEYSLEFRLRHKSGTYRWIYARGAALRDAAGRLTHVLGFHLDVTDRKQLEEHYRQSQKMQAIGQLAGGVAHDFNNLLVVINGYAELIAADLGPSHPSQSELEEIRAAARSAASLTHQLLAFSRRQILQPQVLDLNQVLRRTQRLLARAVGENIVLAMNLSATGRVSADPGQIEQVILNLAVNARDAMPNGGRLVVHTADAELDAEDLARPGADRAGHVLLAVTDTGTGMNAETRAHLFEPFFTTKAAGRGTGLGLATVYGIVKQSGGAIWVDSEPGQGTTFRIYLPIASGATQPAAPASEARSLRGTESVLLLEDQPEVRTVIEGTLRRYGYSPVVAASGAEALAAARDHSGPIHLMLTDVVLPGASGREIARQVVAERPSMRVLYMSGYAEDAIHHHGVLEAGLGFVQKPFTGEALVQKIREVLEAHQPPLV